MAIERVPYDTANGEKKYVYRKSNILSVDSRKRNIAVDFYNQLCQGTINCFFKYFMAMKEHRDDPHAFMFRELQTQTYITSALFDLCDGAVMREHPVGRKPGHVSGSNELKKGRMDYWCEFKKSVFLIEVKQEWIKYDLKSGKPTIYAEVNHSLVSAKKQLSDIDAKPSLITDNNGWCLAFVVAPVFMRGQGKIEDGYDKSKPNMDTLFRQVEDKLLCGSSDYPANIVSCWEIGKKYMKPYPYEDEKGREVWERYPAVFFLGHLSKFTKERV